MEANTSVINKQTLISVMETLYRIKGNFPYSALAFVLEPKDLFKFLDVFGGTTFEVPTKVEFIALVQTCLVKAMEPNILIQFKDKINNDFSVLEIAKTINPEVLRGLSKQQYGRFSMLFD